MKPKALIIAPPEHAESVFPDDVRSALARSVDLIDGDCPPHEIGRRSADLAAADVIVSTWGMPTMDSRFLNAARSLKAVFYAAGSVKQLVTDESWRRGIVISSAAEANAISVAEYTLATILLSLKRFWHFSHLSRSTMVEASDVRVPGTYGTKVGLVSLGAIGRRVARLLQPFEMEVLAFDPFVPAADAIALGVRLATLEELFRECDVVSLHTPWNSKTEGMIDEKLISSMREGATLINTARGALIVENEMIAVLRKRPDLTAILDVTHPEPADPASPLRSLPNVVLTPHIAGCTQHECARMGNWMADELHRYTAGKPLQYAITREMLPLMA
jgi:phosphoglycerate dehydrogenase-like enzyme